MGLPKNISKKTWWILLLGILAGVIFHNKYYVYVTNSLARYVTHIRQPDLKWTMINVNYGRYQGDAHIVQVKGGKTILIDAGYGRPAKERLIPYIRQNQIDILDHVFVSHPHKDHYEGIIVLLKEGIRIKTASFNIPIRRLCDAEIPWGCDYDDVVRFHTALREHGAEIHVAEAGQSFDLGRNVVLDILYAFDGMNTPVGQTDINDLSLVMMLEYSGHKFLFTGDLNQKIGGYLADNAPDIAADVIKIPHHGTDSLAPDAFFEKVNADYALVPSPKGLWCSERSARARNWLDKNNVPVFVNGFSGNVTVVVDDGELSIVPEVQTEISCGELE